MTIYQVMMAMMLLMAAKARIKFTEIWVMISFMAVMTMMNFMAIEETIH